ncbi:hypothetical protein JCM10213_007539 [Rhodosporidiobolus nylandii]
MPHLQHVAVAGAGNIGSFIVSSLLAEGFTVTVLSRSSEKAVPTGASLKVVEYASPKSLEKALNGVAVVVAAVTDFGAQEALVRASKKVGVQLFVPSEFGNTSNRLSPADHPALYGKTKIQQLLKEVALPALLVFNGPFTDTVFSPFLGFDFEARKVNIVGDGNTPISFTTRADVGRFLAHHLGTLTSSTLPSATSPAILRIEGDRKTFREAVALYEATHSGKVEVTHTAVADGEKVAKDIEGDFVRSIITYLLLSWEKGATVDDGEGLSNPSWPEWQPKTVEEVLKEL